MTTLGWIVGRPVLWVVSFVYGLGFALALSASLFGLWLGVLLLLSLWRYGYAVLRYAAQGRPEFPGPGIETCNPFGEGVLVAHMLFFPGVFAWAAFTSAMAERGVFWVWLLLAVLVAIFPASAAIVAISRNLLQSLNPSRWAHVAKTFGSDYLAVVAGFAIIAYLSARAWEQGVQAGSSADLALGCFGGVWLLLASFAFIGATLREHRDDFDIPGSWESREARRERHELEDREAEWQSSVDRAHAYLRSGKTAEGYAALREVVTGAPSAVEDLVAHQWLFETLWSWQDRSAALAIGRKLIPKLLENNASMDALDVFRRCRRQDPDYRIDYDPTSRLLAQAEAVGQTALADELRATLAESP